MYRLLTNLSIGLVSIGSALAFLSVAASAQDRDQPIQIEANKAEYSDRSGVSTYNGNVVLTQGTLVLHGNTLTVTRNKENGNIEAVLVGTPATLEKPADSETPEPVDGRAMRMEYNSGAAILTLTGDAYVKRGGDAISGETIKHDLNSARTQASSSDNGGRVKITIQPDSTEQALAPDSKSKPDAAPDNRPASDAAEQAEQQGPN